MGLSEEGGIAFREIIGWPEIVARLHSFSLIINVHLNPLKAKICFVKRQEFRQK